MSKIPPALPTCDRYRDAFPCQSFPDSWDIGDGWTVFADVTEDDEHVMDEAGEGSWIGRLEWDNPRRTNDYGYTYRPDGMDGAAVKLDTCGRYSRTEGAVWWQPPADVVKMGPGAVAAMRRTVVRLLDQGYYVLRVALVDPDGAEVGDAYLGAVDIGEWSDDRGWLAGYIGDLADEIRSDIVARLARRLGTAPEILEGVAA